MLRSVPPGRAPAVVGCAENQKLPKINARVIRGQAGVGRIAMRPAKHHRVPAILTYAASQTPSMLTVIRRGDPPPNDSANRKGTTTS